MTIVERSIIIKATPEEVEAVHNDINRRSGMPVSNKPSPMEYTQELVVK